MTRNQTTSQTIVVVAMGVVAGAGAVALYQHAGMPGPVAATAGLSAYLMLLGVHAFLWRRERGEAAEDLRADRLRRSVSSAVKALPSIPMPRASAAAQAATSGAAPQGGARPGAQASPQGPHFDAPQFDAKTRVPTLVATAPPPPPQAPPRASERAAALPPVPPAPPVPAASGPGPDDVSDMWSFRPAAAAPKLPPFVKGHAPAHPPEAAHPEAAAPRTGTTAPAAPREADVEVIQDAIKRLLEEVNAAEQSRAPSPPPQAAPAPRAPAASASAMPPPLPSQDNGGTSASIERSIEALRMTAGAMRAPYAGHGAPSAPPVEAAAPPPLPPFVRPAAPRPASPADARARLMADAISAGRIEVALEPILGLEDQQTRHYEISVRLRDADGNPLEVTPDGPDLRGTGLLPLFDGVRVVRTAAIARRLEERGKGGSVFSAFSGESVADEHFLGELAETLHLRASLASQLVLSFTQTDVRAFSTPEWDSLADMRALGFRFAISHMTDLDMDFEALAEQGFVFAKLDASVFLNGLRAPSGHIPSSDVCRHLAKHGLTLVVERIDDDALLARLFGFGVLLGQGRLFGGARPVRADITNDRSRGRAAAGHAQKIAV
ncbi:EAL domain-containing protein [Hyphomicrobium sp.]|uniref:EAL domain-containing protein n=1 Tax=Hyphomicrobium sp. TaxID=82 RepID=UPI002FDFDC15